MADTPFPVQFATCQTKCQHWNISFILNPLSVSVSAVCLSVTHRHAGHWHRLRPAVMEGGVKLTNGYSIFNLVEERGSTVDWACFKYHSPTATHDECVSAESRWIYLLAFLDVKPECVIYTRYSIWEYKQFHGWEHLILILICSLSLKYSFSNSTGGWLLFIILSAFFELKGHVKVHIADSIKYVIFVFSSEE